MCKFSKIQRDSTGLGQSMPRLTELSPELLGALLAHLTYEEARCLLKPSCKRLLALFGPGAADDDLEKTAVIAWQAPTPEFELRKTLRRIEYRWGFHGERRWRGCCTSSTGAAL